MNKEDIKLLIGTVLAAALTWYINHKMGYGPIIANGLIGVVAAVLFNSRLAGAFYVASFVGMSGAAVIPSVFFAGIGGLISGIVIILSPEVYAGMGGKGGTIAAFSTHMARAISQFFI